MNMIVYWAHIQLWVDFVQMVTYLFCRIKSGNPGYLVAFNTADKEVTVSFNKLKHVPEELNVLIKSSNFNISGIKAKLVSWTSLYVNCVNLESSIYGQRGRTCGVILLPALMERYAYVIYSISWLKKNTEYENGWICCFIYLFCFLFHLLSLCKVKWKGD